MNDDVVGRWQGRIDYMAAMDPTELALGALDAALVLAVGSGKTVADVCHELADTSAEPPDDVRRWVEHRIREHRRMSAL